MSEDEKGSEGFDERVRQIAREVSRSVERMAQLDVAEIAESVGVDPDRARQWADTAAHWLSARVESLGDDLASWASEPEPPTMRAEPLVSAGPHPLDPPTDEQGRALSALDSGRWIVEPGSHVLTTDGEGPVPIDAVGLVGELRARDWIAADGEVTLVGRAALTRWMDSTRSGRGDLPEPDSSH